MKYRLRFVKTIHYISLSISVLLNYIKNKVYFEIYVVNGIIYVVNGNLVFSLVGNGIVVNIYLCEDNKEVMKLYNNLLEKIALENNVEINIETFLSGENLLFEIEEKINDVDIIYLDIEMDGINGIETADKLRKLGYKSEIIFLTSCREYVFEAFDSNPLNYILKQGEDKEKFKETFLKAVAKTGEKNKSSVIYKNGGEAIKLQIDDISYFEVINRVVYVHYGKEEQFKFYSSISDVEESVSKYKFKRVHRSFLVNMKYIQSIKSKSIILKTGEEITIGKTYIKDVQKCFSDFLIENINL